jgi:general secretion pathway protein H
MAGFTLIEVLLVLAILGLAAAIALPRFTKPIGLQLDAAARELTGAMRATRSAAIARNTSLVLMLDVERRSFTAPNGAPRNLPAETQITLKLAEPEKETASRGGIRFFPDGSSTGGEVLLPYLIDESISAPTAPVAPP